MSSFMSSSGPMVDQPSSTFHDSPHHQLHDDVQPPLAAVADARFSCSICTEAVIEPVVTHCGHLYCWSCLYRWLEQGMTLQERNELFGNNNNVMMLTGRSYNQNPYYDPSKRVCPVCRAPCSVKRVIPIYVRTDISTTGSTTTGSTSNSNTATTIATDTSSSQPLVTDDDILNTVETVMDDENDHDDDVLNVNDENEDVEDDMVVQMVGIDGGGGEEEEDFNSALHTTGLRNRSRIRSSISEASTNTTIATTNHHGDEEPEHRHHTNTTTTTATTVPRRPVARSSSNLRLEDRADVAAAAAALFPTHSRTSPTSTTNTNTNTQPPAHHPASLAHGMLPLVQQAIRHAAMVAGTATPNNTTNTSLIMNDMIPPIHRLEGMRHNNNNINHPTSSSSSPSTTTTTTSLSNHYGISMMDQPDPTSDFLSWILLLLGIFVLACLILF